jgi:iron complex outermembrane recepter protein
MLHIYRLTLGALLSFTLPAAKAQDAGEPIQDLEAFIVRESAAYVGGTLDPESRPVRGLFSLDMTVHQIPRSVTMISPEHMELLQIDDLRSLSKFGAGTQIINHYGVTGTPIIRGAKGSALLNGMTRSFNLNEMPLSLGSSESIDIIKGPTPPHLSPTHVGGFVNLVPKAPFFDATRGSLALTVGSYDQYRALLDYGGPTLALGRPAAYRVSVTLNREAGYYDRIRNDFESAYFALKTDLTHKVSADFGVEYFHFRSNENAGWNRPTQALIDRGAYILGEPINITDPAFQNTANRDLVSFPLGYGWSNGIQDFNALVVPQCDRRCGCFRRAHQRSRPRCDARPLQP